MKVATIILVTNVSKGRLPIGEKKIKTNMLFVYFMFQSILKQHFFYFFSQLENDPSLTPPPPPLIGKFQLDFFF